MLKSKKKFIEYLLIAGAVVIIVAYAISKIESIHNAILRFFTILTPFYIGFGIAYVLNRPVDLLCQKTKIKRGFAIITVYLTLVLIFVLFSAYVLPQVIDNSFSLVSEITKGVNALVANFQNNDFGPLQSVISQNINRVAEMLASLTNIIVINISAIFTVVAGTFMNVLFGIIISIYMLVDKEKILKLFRRLLVIFAGEEKSSGLLVYFKEANLVFSHFISGLIVEALIVGFLAYLSFVILGVRYAIILALIITFTNVIPYVGPFIGAIPAVTATLFYDPAKALWVAVFIIVLQQIDANLIGPKVMGNYIGLDPIWIILSITIGGGLWGVLGMLLAIPTGAILKIIFSNLIVKYNDAHHNL